MNKIVLIIPYFGNYPNYFQLFLNSCKKNKDINFLLITDNKSNYDYPQNFKIIYKNFSELIQDIQSKFDFEISLSQPYKLCDLRPAYGYLFEEYISTYEFWGHCDVDLIFGDIKKFIPDSILNVYDKIYTHGHLTLYRNTFNNNRMFMQKLNGFEYYKTVFSSSKGFIFDEGYNCSINNIYQHHNIKIHLDYCMADIEQKSNYINLIKYDVKTNTESVDTLKHYTFFYDNGRVIRNYVKDNQLFEEEYNYIHLQKRPMQIKNNTKDNNLYVIAANKFVSIEKIPTTIEEFRKIKNKYVNFQYIRIRSKNLKIKILRNLKRKKC